jgi:hypothetical protein
VIIVSSIKTLHQIDIKLRLLSGDSFNVNKLEIIPLTLKEIKDVGYIQYNQYLSILTLKKEELLPELKDQDISVFDIILKSDSSVLKNLLVETLSLFLHQNKDDVLIHHHYGLIFGGATKNPNDCLIVNDENFNEIVEVIKLQNGIVSPNEADSFAPQDDKAKSIIAKFKKGREEVKKTKTKSNKNDGNIDFADIVSAVSTKSNTYNKSNIWDLTIYQLYDEYKRLEMISSYETNILAMINGAKVENLKHWSASMEDN